MFLKPSSLFCASVHVQIQSELMDRGHIAHICTFGQLRTLLPSAAQRCISSVTDGQLLKDTTFRRPSGTMAVPKRAVLVG